MDLVQIFFGSSSWGIKMDCEVLFWSVSRFGRYRAFGAQNYTFGAISPILDDGLKIYLAERFLIVFYTVWPSLITFLHKLPLKWTGLS